MKITAMTERLRIFNCLECLIEKDEHCKWCAGTGTVKALVLTPDEVERMRRLAEPGRVGKEL